MKSNSINENVRFTCKRAGVRKREDIIKFHKNRGKITGHNPITWNHEKARALSRTN